MAGDAEATRRRLLDAAAAEFAEYGIAGARVDRIAANAKSNKAQIYHYFTSKDGLFDAVLRELAERFLRDSPIDATDLPEYAGRLFDQYEDNTTASRLATWYRLERAAIGPPLDVVMEGTRKKVEAIGQAQRAGIIPTRFEPAELLALVVHLSTLWHTTTPDVTELTAALPREHRRRVVTDAVAALLRD